MTDLPKENLELIRRVLQDGYLDLEIERLVVEEDFVSGKAKATVHTLSTTDKARLTVEGEGVGAIDAVMHGLLERYSREYQSLKTIRFSKFSVMGDIEETKKQLTGSDAVAKVVLEVSNSENRVFLFSDASRSVLASAARAVLAAVEYFVNAERAFLKLHEARVDAVKRSRPDLVQRYTREMSEVVQSTSYGELIERIRKEMGR